MSMFKMKVEPRMFVFWANMLHGFVNLGLQSQFGYVETVYEMT